MCSASGAAAATVRLRLGVRDDLEVPHPRLGLRAARRVQVDLDLLLVGAAGAERHEVDGAGEDRPPVLRHALDAQVVVVDDPALVAHQRQHALALAGLDGLVQRLALGGIALGQAQDDRRRLVGLGGTGGWGGPGTAPRTSVFAIGGCCAGVAGAPGRSPARAAVGGGGGGGAGGAGRGGRALPLPLPRSGGGGGAAGVTARPGARSERRARRAVRPARPPRRPSPG